MNLLDDQDDKMNDYERDLNINMVYPDIKWGTSSKIEYCDPLSEIHVSIGASGKFSIRVNDTSKFISYITLNSSKSSVLNNNLNQLTLKFREIIINCVKNNIVHIIRENSISILQIDEYIGCLSKTLKNIINDEISEFGLIVTEFSIAIQPPNDPIYNAFKNRKAELLNAKTRLKIETEKNKASLLKNIDKINFQGDLIIDNQGIIARDDAIVIDRSNKSSRDSNPELLNDETRSKIEMDKNKASLLKNIDKINFEDNLIIDNQGIIAQDDAIVIDRSNKSSRDSNPELIYCPRCGKKLLINSNYCTACGKKIK